MRSSISCKTTSRRLWPAAKRSRRCRTRPTTSSRAPCSSSAGQPRSARRCGGRISSSRSSLPLLWLSSSSSSSCRSSTRSSRRPHHRRPPRPPTPESNTPTSDSTFTLPFICAPFFCRSASLCGSVNTHKCMFPSLVPAPFAAPRTLIAGCLALNERSTHGPKRAQNENGIFCF